MRTSRFLLPLLALILIFSSVGVSGVFAVWTYLSDTEPEEIALTTEVQSFAYDPIYIISATPKWESSSCDDMNVDRYRNTTLDTSLNLTTSAASGACFEVTIYNNTGVIYYFNEARYVTQTNDRIGFTLDGIAKKDSLAPDSTVTFTITFEHESTSNTSNTSLVSSVFFDFVLDPDSLKDYVVHSALDRFKVILNTPVYHERLIGEMDERNGRANTSYIGNVVGSASEDSECLNELFTDEQGINHLKITIGDTLTNVTAMVKRENVDGNSRTGDANGNEMTLYLTANDIPSRGGSVVVYAAVFTKDENGSEWYQVGEMYTGSASANNYNGRFWETNNSFNTDTWRSIESYNGLGTNQTVTALTRAYLAS